MKSRLTGNHRIGLKSLLGVVEKRVEELIDTQEKVLESIHVKNKKVLMDIDCLKGIILRNDDETLKRNRKREKENQDLIEFQKIVDDFEGFSQVRKVFDRLALAGIFDAFGVVKEIWKFLMLSCELERELQMSRLKYLRVRREMNEMMIILEGLKFDLEGLRENGEILEDVLVAYEEYLGKCSSEKTEIFKKMMKKEIESRMTKERLQVLCYLKNLDESSDQLNLEMNEKQIILKKHEKESVFSFSRVFTSESQLIDQIIPLIPSVFSGNKVTLLNFYHKTSLKNSKIISSDFFSQIISSLFNIFSKSSILENNSLKTTIKSTFLQIKQNIFIDLQNDSIIESSSSLSQLELSKDDFHETLSKVFEKAEKDFNDSHLIFSAFLNVKDEKFEKSGVISFVKLVEFDMVHPYSDNQDWLGRDLNCLTSVIQEVSRKCGSFSFKSSKLTEAFEGKIELLSDVLFVVNLDLSDDPQQAMKTLNFAQKLKMSILE